MNKGKGSLYDERKGWRARGIYRIRARGCMGTRDQSSVKGGGGRGENLLREKNKLRIQKGTSAGRPNLPEKKSSHVGRRGGGGGGGGGWGGGGGGGVGGGYQSVCIRQHIHFQRRKHVDVYSLDQKGLGISSVNQIGCWSHLTHQGLWVVWKDKNIPSQRISIRMNLSKGRKSGDTKLLSYRQSGEIRYHHRKKEGGQVPREQLHKGRKAGTLTRRVLLSHSLNKKKGSVDRPRRVSKGGIGKKGKISKN